MVNVSRLIESRSISDQLNLPTPPPCVFFKLRGITKNPCFQKVKSEKVFQKIACASLGNKFLDLNRLSADGWAAMTAEDLAQAAPRGSAGATYTASERLFDRWPRN